MKHKMFVTVALAVIFCRSLCGVPQEVFLQSAFGWRKNVEKKNARGTLHLSADDGLKLSSPDHLLVRAVSTDVPVENCAENERFLLEYEGRSHIESLIKPARGGMILLNINYADGTRERKLLGSRFTQTTDWKSRKADLQVSKKVKSLSLWCALADSKGTFEIRKFRFTRSGRGTFVSPRNTYENVFKTPEVILVSTEGKGAVLNAKTIVLAQKQAAPVIVSMRCKGDCDAYFAVTFLFEDGSRQMLRNGLVFSDDDKEWTFRKSVFYPPRPVRYLGISCFVPKGNKNFSFKEVKVEDFGERRDQVQAVKVPSNPQDRLPTWIWSGSGFAARQTICLRQEFELPEEPVSGTLNFAADDFCKIFINGRTALKSGSFHCDPVDAAGFLKKGRNCIGAEVTNLVSSAGFLMYGEVKLKSGKKIRITTGTDWKTGAAQGEDSAFSCNGYDDRLWSNAVIINSVTHDHPWRERIRLERFLPEKDYKAYLANNERIKKIMPQQLAAIGEKLEKEKSAGDISFIRKNNLPFINVAGHNVSLGAPYFCAARIDPASISGFDRLSRLNRLGFRVFKNQIYLDTAWKEDGSVDLKVPIERLRHILAAAPDGYLIVGINADPPEWFVKKYPQEMIGYDSTAERIYKGDALKDPLLRPSMASELWLDLCGKAIENAVSQLENSPIGKRIVAYMPTYGVYSEWHYYGMARHMPDTSIPMLKFFRSFLREKYKNDTALQKAWHDGSVNLKDAPRPTRARRLRQKNGTPYKPAEDCRVPDFDQAMGLAVNRCQEHFNSCVRRAAKRRVLVGNYSGYFFGMAYPAFGWHTGTPRIMDSDKMDFQVSPFPYGWRYSGQSGMPRSVWESYAFNNKVAIMEADTRTHQSGPIAGKTSTCMADSIGQINREFCNCFTRGGALWYYDFDRAWLDYPEYERTFEKLLKIWNSENADVARVSEMAVVCDFDSVPYHTAAVNPNTYAATLISHSANEMNFVGAPYDAILMEDVLNGKAPDYKFYVVLNMINNTPAKEAAMRQLLARGAAVLFVSSPEWRGKAPAGADYAKDPKVSRRELRALAAKAGVHFYCDDLDSMVFACRGFVGVHRKASGEVTLNLPKHSADIQQVLPQQKKMGQGREIKYTHPEFGTVLFKI